MKRIAIIFLLAAFCSPSFAFPDEPDLSSINSIRDAKNYYERCKNVVYITNVNKDSLITALWNVYYLGRRLGMTGMDLDQKYQSGFSKIKARTQDEEFELNILIHRIAVTYKAIQGILGAIPFEPLKKGYWLNIESDYFLYGERIKSIDVKDNITCVEYNLNGINFIVFHNIDKYFAYVVTVYHKRKKYYSKKLKKNIYETLERKITLLPEGCVFLTSTFDLGLYFKPSSYEIKGKYYVGN